MSRPDNKPPRAHAVDRDAEREVLGACMVMPDQLAAIAGRGLKAEHFGIQRHQAIWSAMLDLHERGVAVDVTTIRDTLMARGMWERVGAQALGEALDRQGYSWNGAFFAEKIKRLAIQRASLDAEGALALAIAEGDHDATGRVLEHLSTLRDEALRFGKHEAAWLDDVTGAVEASLNPQPLECIPTGLAMLDEHMGGGMERGWFVVVLGPAKSGKSALAINTMAVAAAKAHKTTLVVSLEMSVRDNVRRFLARESGVPIRAQRKGDLTDNQRLALGDAGDIVASWPMTVRTNANTVDEIKALARGHKAKHGLDVLVVDYIQLVDNGVQNLAADIAKTTRGLKRLAVELECLVIALSQPNNDDAKTGDVGLFSGKGSGAIAADCDALLIPLRDSDDQSRGGLNLAGFRHGDAKKWPLGSLVFDGARMVFREPHIRFAPARRYTEEVA